MGLDVYSYIMVGVQANKVIEIINTVTLVTRYNPTTGEPYQVRNNVVNLRFDGVDFSTDVWGYSEKLEEYIEGLGLELMCFTSPFYNQDTIGLIVSDNSNEGGKKYDTTIEELQTKLEAVRAIFNRLGIKEEPEIRLVMRWSE